MSGVTLSGTDPELLNKLHQHFIEHSMNLRKIIEQYSDNELYWKITRYKSGMLMLTRNYSECVGYLGNVYDAFTIENWFNEIKCENPFYIYIGFFANGISFTVIEDAYGIMEE